MAAIRDRRIDAATGRRQELTGRTVLICLIGFFAVVAAANAALVKAAVSTFGGLETPSSYLAGLNFARDVSAATAQEARHWRIDAKLTPRPGAPTRIELSARDHAGQPLLGLVATVVLAHPTDRRFDRAVDMQSDGAGRFLGATALKPGQWDLVIELSRGDERLFRSKERLVLR